jgi:diguanylate cyclase (GGDEF)-like protein
MIDLDHFKQVNDTLGHEVGDRVLVEITRRMGQRLRTTDMLARWGGEEFVILLRFCGQDDARKIAESLRLVVADTPIDPAGQVTISLGVAQLREDDDLTSWLGRADRALYEAKQSGRNTVRP